MAAQSLLADQFVKGFSAAHPMPFVPRSAEPRLWIGNAAKVATHRDAYENVAVVAAGRRRFTLFPPDAEPFLYMGPSDPTPGGTPVSMVHLTAPDLGNYPLFAKALRMAMDAELAPGDAIFIPMGWFHHVEALDRFNVLVNYWWDAEDS
jgi:ribosomal protein L16 Arg81 hydroxylase